MIHASGCFFLSNTTGNICLQLRSTTSNHPKTWAFWGGKSEEGEQPIDVLLREIEEEVGSQIFSNLKKIKILFQLYMEIIIFY